MVDDFPEMQLPNDWQPVGRDGELLLYASPDKTQGMLVDLATGKPRGDPQSLQVFFKWGNFEAIDEEGNQ